MIEGELTFWVGGQVITAHAGSFVYGSREVPHTFTVSSEQARFLLVVEPAGFEGFVRALGQTAQELVIPPPATEPPDVAGDGRARRRIRRRDPRPPRHPRVTVASRRPA